MANHIKSGRLVDDAQTGVLSISRIKYKYQHYIDLIFVLTIKEFKIRYKNSLLGYFWSMLNPVSMAVVYFLAFQIFMRIQMDNYLSFLLAGLFPWQWVATTVGTAPNHFLNNPTLIKKVNFPRIFIVLVNTLHNMIHFLLSLPALVILFLVTGIKPDFLLWLWAIPVLLVISFPLIMGISLIVATVNIFLRDIEHLNIIILQMLFFATPIIYTIDMVPEKYAILLYINPYTPLMVCWKGVLFRNTFPTDFFGVAAGISALLFTVGFAFYKKLSWKFAEVM